MTIETGDPREKFLDGPDSAVEPSSLIKLSSAVSKLGLSEAQLADLIQQGLEACDKPIELAARILAGYESAAALTQSIQSAERESESVALFDLDGTLADFDGAMTRGMRLLAAPGEPIWTSDHEEDEPAHLTARRRLIKYQPGFWSGLPKLLDGFSLLDMARKLDYRPMVLSRGPRANAVAWGEKLAWCRMHLPEDVGVTLTEDKGLVYGRVLVDDWPEYILRWLEWRKRGLVIMPAREWNKDFKHPQVVRYVFGENYDEVFSALTVRRRSA